MIVARWSIQARFGHKDECIAHMKKWNREIGQPMGWKSRALTGSIGSPESLVETEMTVESLHVLEEGFAKLAKNEMHKKFSKELEPHVVSGTNRWEIFRVVEL